MRDETRSTSAYDAGGQLKNRRRCAGPPRHFKATRENAVQSTIGCVKSGVEGCVTERGLSSRRWAMLAQKCGLSFRRSKEICITDAHSAELLSCQPMLDPGIWPGSARSACIRPTALQTNLVAFDERPARARSTLAPRNHPVWLRKGENGKSFAHLLRLARSFLLPVSTSSSPSFSPERSRPRRIRQRRDGRRSGRHEATQ